MRRIVRGGVLTILTARPCGVGALKCSTGMFHTVGAALNYADFAKEVGGAIFRNDESFCN